MSRAVNDSRVMIELCSDMQDKTCSDGSAPAPLKVDITHTDQRGMGGGICHRIIIIIIIIIIIPSNDG